MLRDTKIQISRNKILEVWPSNYRENDTLESDHKKEEKREQENNLQHTEKSKPRIATKKKKKRSKYFKDLG